MELIRGLHNLKQWRRKHPQQQIALTIGTFDGVHRGHQVILTNLREKADELGLPAWAMTFEPQPREFVQGKNAPARLTSFAEKLRLLREYGIDGLFCLRFNQALQTMSPLLFIEDILVKYAGAKHLMVGDDFRFGVAMQGDYPLLLAHAERLGYEVSDTPTLMVDQQRVSSTRVRAALQDNDFELAQRLLSRPYSLSGRASYAHPPGLSELGVAPLNIPVSNWRLPLQGVYAVEVTDTDDECSVTHSGIADIRTRPTSKGERPLLSVYLFDIEPMICDQKVRVVFRHQLRDARKFDEPNLLAQQLKIDIANARTYFQQRPAE